MNVSPTKDTTATAGCDCIKLTNEALKAHNAKLDVTWELDRETGAVAEKIAIGTSLIEKKRGARPMQMIANYCAVCGARYPTKDDAASEPQL